MTNTLRHQAQMLGSFLLLNHCQIAVAESCTGGLIASTLTDIAGSSQWFERGIVSYSNQAKIELLGVLATTLISHGAVSGQTALEMAQGLLQRSPVNLAIAVTGIAGPSGGNIEKPVGTVFIAWASQQRHSVQGYQFYGDRSAVRTQTVEYALNLKTIKPLII